MGRALLQGGVGDVQFYVPAMLCYSVTPALLPTTKCPQTSQNEASGATLQAADSIPSARMILDPRPACLDSQLSTVSS